MKEIFKPIRLKLDRVLKQISELELSILYFNESNLIGLDCILNEGRLGYKLIQKSMPENIPIIEWDTQFGECIYNLRSCLDNFAFALARLKEDPPSNPKQICFPIYSNKDAFIRYGRKYIEQLPNKASEIIEMLQPFNRDGSEEFGRPKDDPLIILSELNNSDKHRIPSVVLITPAEIGQKFCVKFNSEEDASKNVPPNATFWVGPLKPGTILFEYNTISPIVSVEGKYEIKAEVGILYEGRYLNIIPLLRNFHNYINLVISQFNDFIS